MAVYANATGATTIRNAFLTLAKQAQRIRLAAPFFSCSEIIQELGGRSVYLIVRLGPATPPDELGRVLALPNVTIRYFTSPLFHTKLFIFGDLCGLVGSANLTHAGLQSNREAAITVPSDNPDFEDLVAIFEGYWSEAEVFDEDRLKQYRRLWAERRLATEDREFEDTVKKAFGDSLPSQGIHVGRPRVTASKLYLEDYRRTYQTFLKAFREVEAVYSGYQRRKEPQVPLRIEIDQFFNYLRETQCRGDEYLTVPLLSEQERAARIALFLPDWFDSDWPYLHEKVANGYQLINQRLRSAEGVRRADGDAIVEAMEVCHAFTEELRFHMGGLATLRRQFLELNEIARLRRSLEYLLYGSDNFVDRMGALIFDPSLRLAKCGRSVIQELLGWVNGENVPICNGRTLKMLRFLGHDVHA